MTQYNSLNVKLSNPQLNKLDSAIKNETEVVLRLSSNMICNSNDDFNYQHELLLTIEELQIVVKLLQIIHHIDIKPSKTQLYKIIQ